MNDINPPQGHTPEDLNREHLSARRRILLRGAKAAPIILTATSLSALGNQTYQGNTLCGSLTGSNTVGAPQPNVNCKPN